jgi:integrase
VEVVRQVIEAAERREPRLAPLLMLAALTGMRRGELCALRWSDVDFDAGTLTVNHSVVVAPKGIGGEVHEIGPRSDCGAGPGRCRPATATWHEGCAMDQRGARGTKRDAYVFSPYVEAMKPFRPDNVTSFFIRIRDEAVLRRFAFTISGTSLLPSSWARASRFGSVAGRLGHSDPSVILRAYTHAL